MKPHKSQQKSIGEGRLGGEKWSLVASEREHSKIKFYVLPYKTMKHHVHFEGREISCTVLAILKHVMYEVLPWNTHFQIGCYIAEI